MSLDFKKTGIIESSNENILITNKFAGNITISGTDILCTAGTCTMNYGMQITLNPLDIYCIEFDVRCKSYVNQSGVYIGAQFANWDSYYTCQQSEYNFTTNQWESWYNTNNPYYIDNYVNTAWGHVKTYVCGSAFPINLVPPPRKYGGTESYKIRCNRALDGSASNHAYPNQMLFIRLGSNAMNSGTQFEFKDIIAYRLGSLEKGSLALSKSGIDTNRFIEL